MGRRHTFTVEQEEGMTEAVLRGLSVVDVAAKVSCAESTVYRIVRQNKVKVYEKHPELLPGKSAGFDVDTLIEQAKTTRLNAVEPALGDMTKVFDLNTNAGRINDKRQTTLINKHIDANEHLLREQDPVLWHLETITKMYDAFKSTSMETPQTLKQWQAHKNCQYKPSLENVNEKGEGVCVCERCMERDEGFYDNHQNPVKSPITGLAVDLSVTKQQKQPEQAQELSPEQQEYDARIEAGHELGCDEKRWLNDPKIRDVLREKFPFDYKEWRKLEEGEE